MVVLIWPSIWSTLNPSLTMNALIACDKVWSTCCAIHNSLLLFDGLDVGWDETTQDDSQLVFDIPFSMQRLNRHEENVEIRPGTEYKEGFFDKHSKNGKRVVRNLPLDVFQERLIHHFDIRFKRNELAWPKRKRKG